jgi:Ca2+-binding RTX toxin-like protein
VVIELEGGGSNDLVIASVNYPLPSWVNNLTLAEVEFLSGTGNELGNIIIGNGFFNILSGGDGDDTLQGLGGGDSLAGDRGNDRLEGQAGNDSLFGGEGNDTLLGGDGEDNFFIFDAPGHDSIDGGSGTDFLVVTTGVAITVDLAAGTVTDGATVIADVANIETVSATEGADHLIGNALDNALFGVGGDDTLEGGAGNDTLDGHTGADSYIFRVAPSASNADVVQGFESGSDKLVLDGSAHASSGASGNFVAGDARFRLGTSAQDGDDRVIYDAATGQLWYDADGNGAGGQQLIATLENMPSLTATDIAIINGSGGGGGAINGTAGNDTLVGTPGNDTINGLGGNDSISGLGGDDSLSGGDGNDTIDGGEGINIISGGAGIDTVIAETHNQPLPADVENLTLRGSIGFEPVGTGNDLDNVIRNEYTSALTLFVDGGAGNDTLVGGTTATSYSFRGDWGNDVVQGGSGNDSLDLGDKTAMTIDMRAGTVSGGGSGSITFSGIDEVLASRTGNDLLIADDSGVRFAGDLGSDTLVGGAGDDFLHGDEGLRDHLPAPEGGNDSISGGAGNDTLVGWRGNDTLDGGDGDDVFQLSGAEGEYGNDSIIGGSGMDAVRMTLLGDLVVSLAAGTLSGGYPGGSATLSGIENFSASDGNDRITGSAAANFLSGGNGLDTIDGGAGNDTLRGGDDFNESAGDDTFLFTVAPGAANADVVVAFGSTEDKIVLDGNAHANSGASGNFAAGDVRFRLGTSAQDADDRVIFDAATNRLWYDADGNGAGAQLLIATVQGSVTATDIAIVNGSGTPPPPPPPGTNDTITGTAANDTLEGGGGNDSILGGDGNDSILGGSGNDTLRGNSGTDWLEGGTGNDDVGGGGGQDSFVLREMGTANADLLFDFATGWDDIRLDAGAFSNLGATGRFSTGDVRFRAGTSAQDADDRIIFNSATGQLFYDADGNGGGAQQLIATLPAGRSVAASDFWVIAGTTPPPPDGTIRGTSGNDTLMGTDGNDTIDGLGGHDSLYGALGADSMIGGDGNDTLDGSNIRFQQDFEADADTMDGGLGNDLFYVNNVADVLSDAGGTDTVYVRDRDWTLGAGFENLVVNTDFGEFATTGIGNELANVMEGTWHIRLEGLGGNDLMLGAARHDTLLGGDGDDTIDGGGGNDSIQGGAGNDVLRETQFTRFNGAMDNSFGNDTMDGGSGNDTLIGGTESDTLTGGAGADIFAFDQAPEETSADSITDFLSGTDRLQLDAAVFQGLGSSGSFASGDARFRTGTSAQDADDRVIYDAATGRLWYDADGNGAGAQQLFATLQAGAALAATDITVVNGTTPPPSGVITGTPGNDSLTGTSGDDTIDGGAGTDTMNGLGGNDTYFVTAGDVVQDSGGIDTVFAAESFAMPSPVENITFTGTANTNSAGNSLNNVMTGNSGRNFLDGRGGNDTLAGGTGIDTLTGGAGNDLFVFSEMGTANADAINGFIGAEDDLAFDDAVFAGLGSAGSFRSGAGLSTGQDADDRLIYNSSTGQLYYDADGSGSGGSQLVATLGGAPGLTASDITIV